MAGKRLQIPSGSPRKLRELGERLAPPKRDEESPSPTASGGKDAHDLGLPGPRTEAEESSRSTIVAGVLGVALVLGGGLAYRYFASPASEDERTEAPSASASVEMPVVSRCGVLTSATDFLVGEPQKPVATDADAGVEAALDDTPFAAVLGRAIATPRGFAVPVLGDGENGSVMSVVELDMRGNGVSTRLSRSRGDLEPPVLFADGPRVLGAAIEPNASGLGLKLFTVEGGMVGWGAELEQPSDESLVIDVAASGERGVVVWDAVKDDTSRIVMASFRRSDIGTTTAPRAVTDEGVDAEAPRLIPRTSGYFLLYRVRGAELKRTLPKDPADETDEKGAKDEIDESRGEKGYASWIEALRLDENGSPQGSAEPLTPRDGLVTGFDVTGSGDAFTLAWRDEDGPSGSAGGDVHVVHVTTGGPLPAATLRERAEGADEGASGFGESGVSSAGVPVLLGTWVAVPTLRGQSLLAALDRVGSPTETMKPEPSFGHGEPIAQRTIQEGAPDALRSTDVLLVAEPKGRAVNLRFATCVPPR